MDVLVKDTEVKVPEKPLLSYRQRDEMKAELAEIDTALDPSNPYSHLRKNSIDVEQAVSRARRLKKQLDTESPSLNLSGAAKDQLKKRSDALQEKILQGMPTHEEMRKNPAGMVDRHMKWEAGNKRRILEWKNIQKMLEPDSSDKDLSNFERFRPQGEMDRFRGDAQINGQMSYGNIPEWVWERIFDKAPNSALEQVRKVEQEVKAAEASSAKVDGRKRARTEEEKRAFAERMTLARASKQGQSDPLSPQEGESVPFEGA